MVDKKKPKNPLVDKEVQSAVKTHMDTMLEPYKRDRDIGPDTKLHKFANSKEVKKDLTSLQKAIVNLAAAGWKTKEISSQLGCGQQTVRSIVTSESGRAAIDRIQQEIYIKEPQKVAQYMAPKAMKTLYDIMTSRSSKETSRVEASKAILDRAYGKPVQQIEQKGNTIADLFRELDRRDGVQTVEASYVDIEKELSKHGGDDQDEAEDGS